MCHHIPVALSAEDKRATKRLTGVLIPAMALAVVAAFAVAHLPASPEHIASFVPAAFR